MEFHVNQQVECVDASGNHHLKQGCVYTITGFEPVDELPDGDGVFLAEARHDTGVPFLLKRFRPMTDRKSEVSFTMGADPESEKWDNRKRVKVRL